MPTRNGDVLTWAVNLEEQAAQQAQNTASMPFVRKPLALMADAHYGKGSTIGSVIATEGAIIPSAVGVDIGCGMAAVPLGMTASQLPDSLDHAHSAIAEAVPAGVGQGHAWGQDIPAELSVNGKLQVPQIAVEEQKRVREQFGTLGAGNHFVELCTDEDDGVWLVLHSGSRGIGNKIATEHIEKAKGLMAQYFIELPDPDLAYLVEGTPEFNEYINDMQWAQAYAAANRERMLYNIVTALTFDLRWPIVPNSDGINCHHNYTTREHHRGENLWVTRKGAIQAREGTMGIIPGSMATGSFIVRGLGSKASYHSASHGAGRRLSRGAAHRSLDVAGLTAAMDGIAWNGDDAAKALLDEDPRAYKDLGEVMDAQSDLVEPVHRLKTVLNFKGVG